MRGFLVVFAMVLVVSGCANNGLRQLQSTSRGPDEFIVEPRGELTLPDNLTELPAPTPGQANRTDNNPFAEMVGSLGGRAGDPNAAVPSSDGALVTAASRFGVTQNIRGELAEEDAEFRRKQSRFTQFKLFPEDLYNDVYRKQSLDARKTANEWRRAGARTPSYPPQ